MYLLIVSKRSFPNYRDDSNAGPKYQIRLKTSASQHSEPKKPNTAFNKLSDLMYSKRENMAWISDGG